MFNDYHYEPQPENHVDTLRVYGGRDRIKASLNIYKFIDADTRQYIYYMPSLEVTGYGETEEKASEMLKSSVDDLFNHILHLPKYKQQIELSKLGWKQDKFRSKEYSKMSIDINGQLENMNALENKIERVRFVA